MITNHMTATGFDHTLKRDVLKMTHVVLTSTQQMCHLELIK